MGEFHVSEVGPTDDDRPSMSLRKLVELVGGYEGSIRDPATGKRFSVALGQWADRDLDTTFIRVEFHHPPGVVLPPRFTDTDRSNRTPHRGP